MRDAANEKKELTELMLKPAHAAMFSELIPFIVCQRFRNMVPLSADMLVACFDPEQSMVRHTIPRHEQWRFHNVLLYARRPERKPFALCPTTATAIALRLRSIWVVPQKFRQRYMNQVQSVQFAWNELAFKTMRILVKGEVPR